MKDKKTLFSFYAGPLLLLVTMGLLFTKTAPLLGRPVWIIGMILSTLLAVFITFLSAKELLLMEGRFQEREEAKRKEAESLRSVLEETHLLYRKKIAKLEEEFSAIDREISLKDDEIDEMKIGYEKIYDELKGAKSQASSFHASLEDALEELREARQALYLEKEAEDVPKDLVHQHEQLREQFEEKALTLEQTRKRLFAFEGHLIILKKERGEEMLSKNEEIETLIHQIKELEEEKNALETEVALLEELVAGPSSLPKKKPPRPKKKIEQMLELQFDHVKES